MDVFLLEQVFEETSNKFKMRTYLRLGLLGILFTGTMILLINISDLNSGPSRSIIPMRHLRVYRDVHNENYVNPEPTENQTMTNGKQQFVKQV